MNEEPPESPPPSKRKRFRWLKRDGIDLGDAVVQFVAVVVGIVLGVFITQWVAHSHQQAAVHQAMNAIRTELADNRPLLRENATRWYKTATRLMKETPKNPKKSRRMCYMWPGWSGPGGANVTDAAYQTAIATQALAHMPFKQAHQVAEIYTFQSGYRKAFGINRRIFFAKPQTLNTCVAVTEQFAAYDRQLARRYTPLIGPIKTKWPKSPPNPLEQAKASK